MNDANNPLLSMTGLPDFGAFAPEQAEPAIEALLAESRADIEAILSATDEYTWDNTLAPIEKLGGRLAKAWAVIRHMHAVMDNVELRKAYGACEGMLSAYHTEMGQHEGLYRAYRKVKESAEYEMLGDAERRIIDNALRGFRLGGIELPQGERERFRQVRSRLTDLGTRFENNLLDATQAWTKNVGTDSLSGLPEADLAVARAAAEEKGLDGCLLTLQMPCYIAVMTYANDRQLRREMYEAYVTRASDQGMNAFKFDNTAVMGEILTLRHELAQLLGFGSYADYALVTRMAKDPGKVLSFLDDLAVRAHPCAQKDLDDLTWYAQERFAGELGQDGLQPWDLAYYSEKLRQERYQISQEELRPYFPVAKVLEGLFAVTERLYGITARQRHDVSVWHPDVTFFELVDGNGSVRGMFYLDLFARPNKRGGAWMDECILRSLREDGEIEIPVAYVTCNFTPAAGGRPALLTHEEVVTLFHEYGHGLHHMLTCVDYASISGINGVPWDAVELPSQLMENWCWQKEALLLISSHHETGEPLGGELLDRLLKARNFQSALQFVRQLEFAIFDFRLHMMAGPFDGATIQAVLDQVRKEVAVVTPPPFNRFQHGFAHVFAGGYAAGYYSYKWAEVLSADAFSLFEEKGIFDSQTGAAFLHTVLENGGSRDLMELFVRFRGREPEMDALLRHNGLAG